MLPQILIQANASVVIQEISIDGIDKIGCADHVVGKKLTIKVVLDVCCRTAFIGMPGQDLKRWVRQILNGVQRDGVNNGLFQLLPPVLFFLALFVLLFPRLLGAAGGGGLARVGREFSLFFGGPLRFSGSSSTGSVRRRSC